MSRVKHAVSSLKRRKKTLKAVKGQRASRSKLLKTAKEAGRKALISNYIDRKKKKRNFRSLWVARINAACKSGDMSYSRFIAGLKKAGIILNRKMLSEIAISDSAGFKSLVKKTG
ncbi:MAG: 50S ribosomal protein L20 [Candidatus Omnitrophica bacterium]|nr:50S ribosomal protein L20 [Candidatus Omnitrophota bacterium]MBU1128308.1 50S ribosomal protein L20 [Candidatus Omnitrophota bacterium]MBU1784144.1 50S ribosomal protein L20 [Candidatus Omnitrophota bacterium]MBU1851271.1 50S ribosomal protein L20 [Candidatus Omnitrophota bacterium]